ncbi:phosphotriesterase-related protein-like [Liolophura sinensis]|uniref:phosphotriesterase-related protein-like n=1 Tax=Liolophura sinensis TaxID=3198878 RepID=UPI00315897DF
MFKYFCALASLQHTAYIVLTNQLFSDHKLYKYRSHLYVACIIVTVLGLIDPEELGITHTHEHLSMNYSFALAPRDGDPMVAEKQNAPITMENLGWIRQYPFSHRPNLNYNSAQKYVIEELQNFKKYGGSAVVENTTVGLHRDIKFVKRASEESCVHVIAGTGYYFEASLSAEVRGMSVEQLAETMVQDITQGTDGTDIKCGVIGELGCSWPLTDVERRVLQAGAQVQSSLGCPVIIHPGRGEDSPMEVIRVLQEAGGRIDKTVMSHLDRTIYHQEKLTELAETGIFCEYDLFGLEVAHYQFNQKVDMPNDGVRIQNIKYLIDHGYGKQVVIAHDCHTLHRLEKYGGHGMCHILLNIVPHMKQRGITQSSIDDILINNPRRWLAFF